MLGSDKEKKLINRLLKNDNAAFEELVHNYSAKMYAIACRFFSNDDDAQECLQKAFIQVFKNIHLFRQDASLKTWLHRITVNSALMMLRHQKRQKTIPLEEFSQHYNEFGERTVFSDNSGNNLEQQFEKNETSMALNKIIYDLPEKYRNILLLRDIQELSTKDTAAILEISEAAVKTQLHRARLFLKAILEPQGKQKTTKNVKGDLEYVND